MIFAVLKYVVGLPASVGFGSLLCNRRRHTQISKIGNIFEKISTVPGIQNSLIKSVFEHNFFAKSWLTLGLSK
jgi:hypothetical protein